MLMFIYCLSLFGLIRIESLFNPNVEMSLGGIGLDLITCPSFHI